MKADMRMIASTAHCHVILLTLLTLVPLSAFAASQGYCSRNDYGQPNYEACISLLYGTAPVRQGIYNLDTFDHAFFLPYFARESDFTSAQWSHKVTLPEVWGNSECKIALIVGSNIDGSPGIDDGLWGEVAERGKTVLDLCVMPGIRKPYERGGGHGTAGKHKRLFVVIYAWDSAFDLAARGLTPGDRLAINPTGTGLVNLTEPVAVPGVHYFNTTRLTRVLDANVIQDQ